MNKSLSLRIFSLSIMVYMLVAFLWWAYLLTRKNQVLLTTQIDLLSAQLNSANSGEMVALENTDAYKKLVAENKRQHKMILGEGVAFSFTLLIGLWLIHRSYRREMSAARQQSNFLLSITHELKSPIASIRLVLETILKRDLQTDQINRLSNNALKETNRLHELVNDLLFSARLEKAYKPDMEEIEVDEFFEKLESEVHNAHPEAAINFSFPQHHAIVHFDRQAISSVLFNLIENGLKYNASPQKQITVNATIENGNFQVSIADNGMGIPEEEKKNVFKKFYRIGNEDTRQTKGTGLGLYIVKEIIRAHKGRIAIEANQPEGSIFKIILPLEPH
ncbi:MAG: GHKL domain-containing protein [Saprospiraceae bacterium]|nr:GHKL domain-containing protein [Saprospiraceae bacterium]